MHIFRYKNFQTKVIGFYGGRGDSDQHFLKGRDFVKKFEEHCYRLTDQAGLPLERIYHYGRGFWSSVGSRKPIRDSLLCIGTILIIVMNCRCCGFVGL